MSQPVFGDCFAELDDPRVDRTKRYPLIEVVTIALCSVICGGEGWEDMEEFGRSKETWLRERLGLELANGIPGDDTYRRVFRRLDPEQFAQCLARWIRTFQGEAAGEIIALDGKTLRHSFDTATGQAAIHLVNAWATQSGLALGQVKVDGKSNEITALPGLLRLLALAGCVVTADAMGCQKKIAQQIIEAKADYVLALKGNQGSLHEDVRECFEDAIANDFYQKDPDRLIVHSYHRTVEKDHGRIEERQYWAMEGKAIAWLLERHDWVGLRSICAVKRTRTVGEQVTSETRYFISSLEGGAAKLVQPIRSHWRIENSLHWVLDVSMGEDACRIWQDHAPENMATLRRTAVSLLKQERSNPRGIKARSKKACLDDDYRLKVLVG